jgi:hypothetical protein
MNPVVRRYLTEWQPTALRDAAGVAFFVSVAVVVAILVRKGRSTPWPALLSLAVFFVLALPAVRGVYWWAMAAPVVLAGILADAPERPAAEGARGLNTAIAVGLIALAVALLPWWRVLGRPRDLLASAPRGVTGKLEQVALPGQRLFAPQHWSSWFELRLPRNPTFVDTRAEIFPASVWDQYARVSLGHQGWQEVLDRWQVSIVITDSSSQSGLESRISRDPAWRRVYADADGMVFIRDS